MTGGVRRELEKSHLQGVCSVGGWLARLPVSLTVSRQQPANQIHRSPPVLGALERRANTVKRTA